MEVAGDLLRLNVQQGGEMRYGMAERIECRAVLKIADMLAEHGMVTGRKADGAL